jgi:hypothetical protein
VPTSQNARLFYRCAFVRLDEARILRKAGQITTGPVYLAGYSIECILKALILNALTQTQQEESLRSFRGTKAHDYDWLRDVYLQNGGTRFPSDITRSFTLVNDWSTDMRYVPRNMKEEEIDAFLKATREILIWADGRL